MVTRTSDSGKVHGLNQAVTLDEALKASTINGAYQLKRDKDIGSLEVGKFADLIELSADITAVKPSEIVEKVKVQGTWLGGKKIDLTKFIEQITAIDPSMHKDLANSAIKNLDRHWFIFYAIQNHLRELHPIKLDTRPTLGVFFMASHHWEWMICDVTHSGRRRRDETIWYKK